MHKNTPLCLKSFRRLLIPNYKTSLNKNILYVYPDGVVITKDTNFCIVQNNSNFTYYFFADTNHELLLKLLKHNLIN